MKYNIHIKNLCILLVTIFLLGGYVMAENPINNGYTISVIFFKI